MKVLYISGTVPPIHCGVGLYTNQLLQLVRKEKSLTASILTATTKEQLDDVSYSTQDSWRIRDLWSLLGQIKQERPTIVHIQYPTTAYRRQVGINVLALGVRLFVPKIKVVVTVHELHELRFLARYRTLLTCMGAHNIIVSNAWDQSELPQIYQKRSVIIPIAGNIQNTNKTSVAEYGRLLTLFGLRESAPTLCFFGKVSPNKGVEVLVASLAQLPRYQLVIIGDKDEHDPYHQEVLDTIASLDDPSRVAWPGYLPDDDVSTLLAHCRYFVIAQQQAISTKSGTLLAAVAHGAIAVVHGDETHPERYAPLKNKDTVYFYHPNTPEELAIAISKLDNDEALQKTIREHLPKLRDYFSWPSIAQKHLALYAEITKE
jgi:glycosyltransferase involved in cell wall biosynthesis